MLDNISMEEKKGRILVVDDVAKNIQILGNILRKEGYQIAYATNGADALSMLLQTKFDLILLDIMMPELDGYETCKKIKDMPDSKDIPVIFLTARTDTESIVKGFELGGEDYITKPFNAQELLARVRTHVELRQKKEFLHSINDILKSKVQDKTKQLNDANERLSILEKAKGDFLKLISHEMRTPLNGMVLLTEQLEKTLTSPAQNENVQYLKTSIQKLLKFSSIALLITSLKAESYQLDFKTLPIEGVVKKVAKNIATNYQFKNVDVEYDVSKDNTYIVKADPHLLEECFSIVLDNAFRFSPSGSKITVLIQESDPYITIKISDNGPGFHKKYLKTLFEYFSTDNIDYHTEGLGLGLSASKLIIDSLSGLINVENKTHESGAIVTIHLKKI
ncbi:hybrid sensor histidine kinase/response regulator [bacterium]|nr:hybrid sensor histidine kinase/response regulator [bacterium]